MNEKTPTTLRVPKGSVKRIMKMDDEVKMVAADAVFLMGKACVRSASLAPPHTPPSTSCPAPHGVCGALSPSHHCPGRAGVNTVLPVLGAYEVRPPSPASTPPSRSRP